MVIILSSCKAIESCIIKPYVRLVERLFVSSQEFRTLLQMNGIRGSMNRKGDYWDNAVVESFSGTLKQERVH